MGVPFLSLILAASSSAAAPAFAPCAENTLAFPSGFVVRVERDCTVAAGDALGIEPLSYLFTAEGEIRTIRDDASFEQRSRLVFPRVPGAPEVAVAPDSQVRVRTATGIVAVFSIETKKLLSVNGAKLSLDLGRSAGQTLPLDLADPHGILLWTDGAGGSCPSLFFELFFGSPFPGRTFRFDTDARLRDYLDKTCPDLRW